LGGGLELALHADHHVVPQSVRAVGFPAVRLGLLPGWGGSPRAAALLGSELAARLVITDSLAGKNLTAAAAELGLVDSVLPGDDFLATALDFVVEILSSSSKPAVTKVLPLERSARFQREQLIQRAILLMPVARFFTLLSGKPLRDFREYGVDRPQRRERVACYQPV
jgi:enoyl-CoA hydratase/carnithine racemase